jgi:hypothetical protein
MASGVISRLIVLQLVIGLLTGCMVRPITRDEELSIQKGDRVLVLLRMTAVVEGVSHDHALQDVSIGLGSFDTVGEVTRIDTRCLSEETREQGWLFFIVEPEVYYLAFGGGTKGTAIRTCSALQTAQKWRIDIPENASSVYIGTVHIRCRNVPIFFFLRNYCDIIDEVVVVNEEEVAREVVADHVPGIGRPETVLLRSHDSPTIILRVPKSKM